MPSVLPASSVPTSLRRSQRPSRSDCTACGMCRASEIIKPKVSSTAESVFAAGVFSTTTPASVAAGTSIESTPTPARATTVSCGPAASKSRSTRVSERTISPSAVSSDALRSSRERPTIESTVMPASRRIARPCSANDSATTTRLDRLRSIVERSFTLLSPRLRSTSTILVAFAVPLGVYLASLRGDVSFWDTGRPADGPVHPRDPVSDRIPRLRADRLGVESRVRRR